MKSESKKTEELTPKDSERKEIRHPEDDSEAVVKPEDQVYEKEEADFKDIAKKKEKQEQPVHPIVNPPRETKK